MCLAKNMLKHLPKRNVFFENNDFSTWKLLVVTYSTIPQYEKEMKRLEKNIAETTFFEIIDKPNPTITEVTFIGFLSELWDDVRFIDFIPAHHLRHLVYPTRQKILKILIWIQNMCPNRITTDNTE